MQDQEAENVLREAGMTEEKLAELKTQMQESQSQPATETTPAATEKPAAEATTEKPAETGQNTETELWEEDDVLRSAKPVQVSVAEVTEDYKAKFEETNGKLTKIESDKFLKTYMELKDHPDFELEKFLEAQVSKKVDYTHVPLEALYKQQLKANTAAGYTDEDIDELWEKKEANLSVAEQKELKAEIVNRLLSAQVPTEEPALIKEWKQERQQQVEQAQKEQAVFQELNTGISTRANSLIGKKFGGVVVTKEDVAAIPARIGLSYYMENGKINHEKVADDQLKVIMFDKIMANKKVEVTKEIVRPNSNSGGGSPGNTDSRSENEKILDQAAQEMGLKSHKDLIQ